MVCSFFGHKNTPSEIYVQLRGCIEELIQNRGVDGFIVGNQGAFDSMVLRALRELKQKYSHIRYYVVLAYIPGKAQPYVGYNPNETILPQGIETVPIRFAISWRNKWMVRESDIVIGYVTHSWGGAAQFLEYAHKKGKEVINLTIRNSE